MMKYYKIDITGKWFKNIKHKVKMLNKQARKLGYDNELHWERENPKECYKYYHSIKRDE